MLSWAFANCELVLDTDIKEGWPEGPQAFLEEAVIDQPGCGLCPDPKSHPGSPDPSRQLPRSWVSQHQAGGQDQQSSQGTLKPPLHVCIDSVIMHAQHW